MMRKILVFGVTLAAALAMSVVPASAGEAEVLRWSGTYSGTNAWTNPCTGQEVMLVSTVEVGGVVVRDATGEVHARGYSNLIEGYEHYRFGLDDWGEPTGWVLVDLRVNESIGGGVDFYSGAAHWLWQWHIVVENPDTGQRYSALLNNNTVITPDGEMVVTPGPWGSTPHNTCLGVGD